MIIDLKHSVSAQQVFRSLILKSIASDLRGRLDGIPNAVLVELEARITAAVRSKGPLGYGTHALRGVGEGLIARWPCVKQSLERFGAEK
jgi:hypothetical protein